MEIILLLFLVHGEDLCRAGEMECHKLKCAPTLQRSPGSLDWRESMNSHRGKLSTHLYASQQSNPVETNKANLCRWDPLPTYGPLDFPSATEGRLGQKPDWGLLPAAP